MILEALIQAFAGLLSAFLELLPDWTPIDLSGAIADLGSGAGGQVLAGLGWLNHFVPVDTMVTLLGLSVTIWAATYLVRMTIWVLQLFHVFGGS